MMNAKRIESILSSRVEKNWFDQNALRGSAYLKHDLGDAITRGYVAGTALIPTAVLSTVESISDFVAGTALQIVGEKEAAKDLYSNSWSGKIKQKVRDYANPAGNKTLNTIMDVGDVVADAAVLVGLTLATGGAAGAAAGAAGATGSAATASVKAASLMPIFLSAAGSGTAEAVQTTGELGAKENIYGVTTGAVELATEYALGAGGKILRGVGFLGEAGEEATKGIARHAVLKGIITNASGEFMEESMSYGASVGLKNMTGVDPNAKFYMSEMFQAGLMGSVAGGVLGFGNSAISVGNATSAGKRIVEKGEGAINEALAEASALVSEAAKTSEGTFTNMVAVDRVNKALSLYQEDAKSGKLTKSRQAYYLGQISQGLYEVEMYDSAAQYGKDIANTVGKGGEDAQRLIDGANAMFEENLGRKLTAEDFASVDSIGTKMLSAVSVYKNLTTPTDAEMVDISIRNESAAAFSPEQMASDITALADGEGTAVYNLGNGKMAVVTKRKGDGTISVGLIENKNTNAIKATHGIKSIEGAVSLVKSMQDGTYGQPKPQTAKEIVKEGVKITEKNVENANATAPKSPEAPKAAKKPDAPKKAEAKKAETKAEKKKAPEKEAKSKTESEKKSSEQNKQASETPAEELSTVEDRLRGKKYAGTTFTAEEINAARADFKYFDALSPKVRSDILIMRRSAKEAKIDAQKVKGLTRLMAAYKFSATFSSEIKSNGFWRHGKNLLVVNPNDIYQSTFGHELSHRVEDYKGYDEFASAVESLVGKARLDAEMKKYLADYNAAAEVNGWKKWDAEKNAEDLRREAVANIVGKYLSNAEYIDKLANADRGFVYRIYRSIKGMKRDIALANKISTEAETSKLTEYRTIRRMEKVFEISLGLTEKQGNTLVGMERDDGISYNLASYRKKMIDEDVSRSIGGRGNGYDGYSMSNNARTAYEEGEKPLSKWTKTEIVSAVQDISPESAKLISSVPLAVLRDKLLYRSSWHHTSSHYNATDFYSIDSGIVENISPDLVAVWKNKATPAKQIDSKNYNGDINYIEWGGTRKHPKPIKKSLENVTITEKGSFYIIKDKNGEEILRKKIGSNGTYVRNIDAENAAKLKKAMREETAKRESSAEAYSFYRHLNEAGYELSTSGHYYERGRKPSRYDYDNGLSNFFEKGERRVYQYPDGRLLLQEWDGSAWVSENTTEKRDDALQTSRSVSSTDRAYLDAVKRGDMDTAQRMVDEAAKKAGYDSPKLYHGTRRGGFTIFDENKNDLAQHGFFFTTSLDVAKSYFRGEAGTIYTEYVRMKNPLVVEGHRREWSNLKFDIGNDVKEYQTRQRFDGFWEIHTIEGRVRIENQTAWSTKEEAIQAYKNAPYVHPTKSVLNTTRDIVRYAYNKGEFDGVIIKNTIDMGDIKAKRKISTLYIPFVSNQIKSADPVTYDDDGNVIPLSERFNAEDNDIRRSVSSRIVFGTPANTVGVKDRAKGVIEKVKGIVTDKAERKAALEKLREAADHFSVLASNSFAAVETQLRRMGDGTYQRITRQAAQEKVQLIRVAEAKGLGMLTIAQFKFDGTEYEHSEALLNILEPVLAKKGETIKGQDADGNEVTFKSKEGGELGGELYEAFSDYLVMLNAIERDALGKNPFGNMTVAEMQSIANDYESKHPEFKKLAEKWSQFNRNLLQYRVDAGLMSQETADELHAKYPHYIPMMKPTTDNLQSTGPVRGRSSVEVVNNIRKAKGGDHLVNDPIATYCNTVIQTVKAAQVNDLMRELYRTADDKHVITDAKLKEIGEEMDNVAEAYINDPDSNPDAFGILNALTVKASEGLTNAVYFYENGERKAMKVSKDIFTGLQGANKSGYNFTDGWMLKGIAALNSGYKRLITSMNPFFSPKNMVRDFMDGLLHSRFKLREFLIEYVRVGKDMAAGKIVNDPLWAEFIANGGLQSSLFDRQDARLSKRSKRTGLESNDASLVGKTMQTVENFNVLIEALPRFTEYKLTRNKGGTVAEAINNSAEVTTNFARAGVAGGFLNKTIMPFLNPSIQGFSKPIRNVIENATPRGMLSLLIRAAMLGIVPIILNNLLYGDDEDYEVLEDSTKENNFVIKMGDSWLKIPRGRVVSVVSGIFNRSYNQMTGRYVDWKDYLDNVKSQATPIDSITRTIFSPFKDVSTNTTWYGGTIENESMQNLAPEDRYDEYTSSLAIAIGKVTGKAFDTSPKKVHYLLDQYSGIIGDLLLPMTSTATRSNPLTSNFSVDVTQNTNLSDRFYKLYNESLYAKNRGDEDAYYLNKRLGETKQQVSDLYKQIKEINTSGLSKAEKREQTAILRATINQLYKAAIADAGMYSKAVKAASGIPSAYKVVKVTSANAKKLGAEKDSIGKYALTYSDQTVRFFDDAASAEEYKTSVGRKTTYAEANRLVYGAQYAMNQYSTQLGEKAETIARLGVDAETFYGFYMTTRYYSGSDKKKQIEKYCKAEGLSKEQTNVLLYFAGFKSYREEVQSIAKRNGFSKSELEDL